MIRIFVLTFYCAALLMSADKPKATMTAKITIIKEELKDPGYYTVEKDNVHITSLNSTIDLVLPRIGKDETTGKERPRDFAKEVKIHYPVTSEEWNDYFIDWMWRVQHVHDSGHVPTKAELDAEWRKDHPLE